MTPGQREEQRILHLDSGVLSISGPIVFGPSGAAVLSEQTRLRILTLACTTAIESAEAVTDLYGELAAAVAPENVDVLHEKIFLDPQAVEVVNQARTASFTAADLDPNLPRTMVLNRPCVGGMLAGVQLWLVEHPPEGTTLLTTVVVDEQAAGRLLDTGYMRMLFLNGITGSTAPGGFAADHTAQCRAMFERTDAILRKHDFVFSDVARTWIHVDRLLDWYTELNDVRNAFFDQVGVRRPGQPFAPPASTGIQGGGGLGAEVFMDVLAIKEAPPSPGAVPGRPFQQMRTNRQNEAPEYASAFSRGMAVCCGADHLLLVSGTASIDRAGNSVFHGDVGGQIEEAFRCASAVLEYSGASCDDAVTAVLFFKNESAYEEYRETLAIRNDRHLPAIAVFADVCRDELLFELEITASRSAV